MIKIDNLNVPESWDEVTFGRYIYLTNFDFKTLEDNNAVSEFDHYNLLMAVVLGTNEESILNLSYPNYVKLQSALKFLEVQPERKTSRKWKFIPLKELTMDKWVTYERLKDDFANNAAKIIELLQNDYTLKEIIEMPTTEVLDGFFTLQRHCRKSIKRSHVSLVWRLWKWKVKQIKNNLLVKMRLRKAA